MSLFAASRTVVETVASAHDFAASGLSPAFASPVVRVNETPLTDTVVVARTVVVPVAADVIVSVQLPVVPTVVHWFEPTNAPGPDWTDPVQTVPAGAFAKQLPSLTLT
jgi:hypothetical protein